MSIKLNEFIKCHDVGKRFDINHCLIKLQRQYICYIYIYIHVIKIYYKSK
jgi:hypothetical protein